MKNINYKLEIKLLSPLSIGSGKSANTDSDVIVDRRGQPYIPASAITGVLRNYVHSVDEEIENAVFGSIEKNIKTLIRVYDARLNKETDDCYIAVRHRVALENKIVKKGAKFDLEAVEPDDNSIFTSFIQLSESAFGPEKNCIHNSEGPNYEGLGFDDCVKIVEQSLSALSSGDICLGSNTTRGYGRVNLSVYKKEFTDVEDFLDFDIYEPSNWDGVAKYSLLSVQENNINLTIRLKLVSAISIREYSTEQNCPDFAMMSLHKLEDAPVIPGTSWAGAFRTRFIEFVGKEEANNIFGCIDERNNKAQKSKIRFSESRITSGKFKDITRNSLDRFSMATKKGALYTERTYYGGETDLQITLPTSLNNISATAIGACLIDLHRGYLAIGGLTSIGRGLFEITDISSNNRDGNAMFLAVKNSNPDEFAKALI